MKKITKPAGWSLCLALCLFSITVSGLMAAKLPASSEQSDTMLDDSLRSLINPLVKNIANKRSDLNHNIFARMLEELDHSGNSYILSDTEVKEDSFTPAITVRLRNGVPTIVAIQPSSDAWRKNIMCGDIILGIQNVGKDEQGNDSCAGETIANVNKLLRGKAGSKVHIKVLRKSADKVYKIALIREEIKGEVFIKTFVDQVIYIKPTRLDSETVKSLPSVLPETKTKLIGVILDLRGTIGGGIDEAKKMAELFINKGTLVQVVKNTNVTSSIEVSNVNATTKARLVVIVDEGTGIAAEIVAAALQEKHRAVVMGKSTCGLGATYTTVDSELYGKIRLPSALLMTPEGKPLFNKGILPDIPAKYGNSGVKEWGKFRHEILALLNDVKPEDLEWPGNKLDDTKDENGELIDELSKDGSSEDEEKSDDDSDKDNDKEDSNQEDSVEEQILTNYPLVRKLDRPFVRALNLLVSMNIFFSETGKNTN